MIIPEQIDIKDFLPHRAPMLMVDELVAIDDRSASCRFRIDEGCLFLHKGELSGTGLIEHAAQTSTAVVGQRFFPGGKSEVDGARVLGFISAIRNIELGPLPRARQTLITRATLLAHVPNGPSSLCVMEVETTVEGRPVLRCSMNLVIEQRVP